jgi:hypothetical protein
MLQCSIPERGEQLKADRDAFGGFDPLIGAARPNLRLVAVPMRNHERTSGTPKVRGGFHG